MGVREIRRGIAFRIWAPLAVVLALSLTVLGFDYANRQTALVRETTTQRVKELAQIAALGVELAIERNDYSALTRAITVTTSADDFAYVAIIQEVDSTRTVFAVNPKDTPAARVLDRADATVLRAEVPIGTPGLTGQLVVAMSQAEVERDIARLNRPLYQFMVGILVLALALLLFVSRLVSRPIRELTEVANALRAGRYDVTVQPSWHATEIDALSDAFRALRDTLDEARRRMAESTAGLLRAKQAAEAADQAKSAFVANMSHEIRTPLNALVGLSHLCLQTPLSDQQRDYLAKIDIATQSLLGLVNNVLDFAKIDADALELEREAFAVSDVFKRVDVIVGDGARAKGLAVSFAIDPALPRVVVGDALRLQQVLVNLVGNAVKFTPRGRVEIVACSAPSVSTGAASTAVEFRITDTGIGISEEQQERLFRPFSQADSSITRMYGGSGLGLVICQRLIEVMGGQLTMDSTPDVGTTFRFTVPFGLPVGSHGDPYVADSLTGTPDLGQLLGQRVLVVEDNAFNQQVDQELLERAGMVVTVAANGVEALEQLDAIDGIALVLMDIQMPVMDGLEATRRIRAMARHATVPVVAMTANVSADDRRLCLEAGMHDVIGKPIVPARLLTTIQRWIMQPAQADVPFSTTGMTDVAEVTVNIEPTMLTFDSLRELVDGDDEALNELLITFQASLVETRASLRAARDAGDSEALAFLAHRFKSAAGQLEAHGCATLCGAVQVAARQDPTMALPETGALIDRLLESMDALDESIRVSLGRSLTT